MDFLLKNVKNNSYYVHGKLLGQPVLKLDIVISTCFFQKYFRTFQTGKPWFLFVKNQDKWLKAYCFESVAQIKIRRKATVQALQKDMSVCPTLI